MKHTVALKALEETRIAPAEYHALEDGGLFVDFGRAAFGTVLIRFPERSARTSVVLHLGERLDAGGRIDRAPPGTIRYLRVEQSITPEASEVRLLIPPDTRNTGPAAVRMPEAIGEVTPFRYLEIEEAEGIGPEDVRQVFVHYPFDDKAACFECSDDTLKSVWDLCKYSIKATTFCGVYVDGDRERIPYEGDAYINQLGHYCVDHEYDFARYSHEVMIQKPTWPSEWHMHSVMMAWADYMYSGAATSLEAFYDDLGAKTLLDFRRDDGLISTSPEHRSPEMNARLHIHEAKGILVPAIRDVLDWPPGSFTDGGTGERDNHEMCAFNTVTNAFHAHALHLMSLIAAALGRPRDRSHYGQLADETRQSINDHLFDAARGVYLDGEGSQHASLHSNMFMLAFDLVPDERKPAVVDFVKSRGMACSVYGAQHLLDALYLNGEDEYALELMCARHDRSWWNMLACGSTITLEAWDLKYKNNLDWNHAWGAAPANIVGRRLLGVRPLEPGFKKILVQPQIGSLTFASGIVPTPAGGVGIAVRQGDAGAYQLDLEVPSTTCARILLGADVAPDSVLELDGRAIQATRMGRFLAIDEVKPGTHTIRRVRLS